MSNLGDILRLFQIQSQYQTKPKVIKLNFRDIRVIGIVDPLYHNIEELSLNHNHLQTLDGIEQFQNLKSLSVNFNNIGGISEMLKVPKSLKQLDCKSNPKLVFDTEVAIRMFPCLTKFNGSIVRIEKPVTEPALPEKPRQLEQKYLQQDYPSVQSVQSDLKSQSSYRMKRLHQGQPSHQSIDSQSSDCSQIINKFKDLSLTLSPPQLLQKPPRVPTQFQEVNMNLDKYLREQTLDVSETLSMLHARKKMSIQFKVLQAWRNITKKNLITEFSSTSSLETHNARMRFRQLQEIKSIDYSIPSSSSSTEDETRDRLQLLKRLIMNFLVYRVKSKQVVCFQKWKKLSGFIKEQTNKKVGFRLDAEPSRKSVKNVLLQKNRKMLKKVLMAWCQYVQKIQLKRLKIKEKQMLTKVTKIKKSKENTTPNKTKLRAHRSLESPKVIIKRPLSAQKTISILKNSSSGSKANSLNSSFQSSKLKPLTKRKSLAKVSSAGSINITIPSSSIKKSKLIKSARLKQIMQSLKR